ncbi:hypothetical protein CYLTODRAFT_39658 [Cylindrobasidium torrendii FP15055 ss-10]|uniref:Uncharacterized protein n=1 Tax=Cylindrobasidium torrendii FP15055 ss-10 TaxID=1314674 RepID=A0A0D7B7N2_9AGAR|nr:hypothetical protein CYLTODRAFT_39658 [Cylindrobasidium torrendii FP15055 ss-10]
MLAATLSPQPDSLLYARSSIRYFRPCSPSPIRINSACMSALTERPNCRACALHCSNLVFCSYRPCNVGNTSALHSVCLHLTICKPSIHRPRSTSTTHLTSRSFSSLAPPHPLGRCI